MKNNSIYSLMCVEILIITLYNILRIADGKFSYLSSSNTQGIFLLSKLISILLLILILLYKITKRELQIHWPSTEECVC